MQMDNSNSERLQFVEGLRRLADFYEARPEFPLPSETTMYVWMDDKSFEGSVRLVAQAMGKASKQIVGESFFTLVRQFGLVKLEALWTREKVCERVVVGTEEVEETVPVTYETRMVKRDKVVWHCPDAVLREE